MRDILLVTLEYPPYIGGVAMYYSGLAKALGGDRIAVLAHSKGEYHESHVPVIRAPLLASWGLFRWWKCLWETIKAGKAYPARFIGVGQLLPVGLVALILHRVLGKRYIVFCHGMDILKASSHPWKRKEAELIMRYASLIVVNSASTLALVRTHFHIPSHRCVVVYPCVEVEPVSSRFRFDEHPTILSVTRLVARKGIARVIKALPNIFLKVPHAHYVVIGDGPERENLVRLAQKTFFFDRDTRSFCNVLDAGRVRFLGALDRPTVLEWYQACDVFALPVSSLSDDIEGFGIVFLEAALFGKPVVAGASGGVPEAVIDGETGILVQPDDANALTEALVRLLKDANLRESFGMRAKARVMKYFQWKHQRKVLTEALNHISE